MRALITNDDGVDSPGIRALADAAVHLGLETVVAAPSWDSSGSSASLAAVQNDGRFLFEERHFDEVPSVRVFAVDGAPGFIARVGVRGAFGPRPDIVLTGVNTGPNTGHAVLHSGTVGAALTACTHGCAAVAFSLDARGEWHWETAVEVARLVIPWALRSQSDSLVLNVNVPDVPLSRLRGVRRAELSPFGAVQTNVTEVGAGYLKLAYTEIDAEHEDGTDAAWLAQDFATVTPLRAVCEAADVDVDELELDWAVS